MRRTWTIGATIILVLAGAAAAQRDPLYYLRDVDGGRNMGQYSPHVRYVYAWDPKRPAETSRPYLHVFDAEGKTFITRAPGADPTERGISLGWNRCRVGSKTYDFETGKGGARQQHVRFAKEREKQSFVDATMASVTDWLAPDGKALLRETRTVRGSRPDNRFGMTLDFDIQLEALKGGVKLEGDPHQGGFQFAADAQKTAGETRFVVAQGATAKGDVWDRTSWAACYFTAGGKRNAVSLYSHPSNPGPVRFSTRGHGRMAAFSPCEVLPGKPVRLRYRMLVYWDLQGAEITPPEIWQASWDRYAAGK